MTECSGFMKDFLSVTMKNIYPFDVFLLKTELLDLISQQNCAVQEENASKNTTIKTLVENQAAITQALNEVKNEIVQEFHKIKSTKIMNLRQKVTKK